MDIKHLLSLNPLRPAYAPDHTTAANVEVKPVSWLGDDGGLEHIGHRGDGFAFDIEGPRHRQYLGHSRSPTAW